MPAPRAALHDIEKLKLSHVRAHSDLSATGRLRRRAKKVEDSLTDLNLLDTLTIDKIVEVIQLHEVVEDVEIVASSESASEADVSKKRSDDFFKSRKQKKVRSNSV